MNPDVHQRRVIMDIAEMSARMVVMSQRAVAILHRLANTGSENIVFIEVQTGDYFGEDDIERIEDDYGRF